jgi:mannose-6-phosphate isomerase-like protein (cupin superfamily)
MKVVKRESSPRYKRDKIESFLLVSSKTTNSKNLCVTLVEMKPDGFQHIHSHKSEQVYYILEGEGTMTVGVEESVIKAGDCIFIPSQTKHGLKNTKQTTLKYLSAASPSFTAEECTELWPLTSISG